MSPHLQDVLSEGHGGVEVEEPGEEALHTDHEGRRQGERLPGLALGIRAQQAHQQDQCKCEEDDAATISECMVLLLQLDGLFPLQQFNRTALSLFMYCRTLNQDQTLLKSNLFKEHTDTSM